MKATCREATSRSRALLVLLSCSSCCVVVGQRRHPAHAHAPPYACGAGTRANTRRARARAAAAELPKNRARDWRAAGSHATACVMPGRQERGNVHAYASTSLVCVHVCPCVAVSVCR